MSGIQRGEKQTSFLLSGSSQSGGEVNTQVPWKVLTRLRHVWSGKGSWDPRRSLSVETESTLATGPGVRAVFEGAKFQTRSVPESPRGTVTRWHCPNCRVWSQWHQAEDPCGPLCLLGSGELTSEMPRVGCGCHQTQKEGHREIVTGWTAEPQVREALQTGLREADY